MFKIYYTHEGEITMVGSSTEPGEHITCDLATLEKLQGQTHLYEVKNKQLVKKQLETSKPPRKIQIVDHAPGWICQRDNFFEVIEYAEQKPIWFDERTHSWVQYD